MDRFDDPKTYRQKRESFTRSLHHFHETRGTPFKRIPQFCGKEVDLFKLYNIVTQRGGWVKVNRTNQWEDILEEFSIPKGCVNGGNALKQIYLRYLDRYEKVHYLGESGDRHELDEEDIESRHRRWSTRSMHTVPLTYNYHQHVVVDNLRKFNGLSSDIYKPSDYDRLALSLVSPLPNEQDYAINVCTLLSNEGKYTLKLDKCPRIIDYLLAHAGIYNHANLRVLFEEIYGHVRGYSLSTFWSDVLESEDYLDLTDENKFVKKPPRKLKVIKVVSKSPEYSGNDYNQDILPNLERETSVLGSNLSEARTVSEIDLSQCKNRENNSINIRINESSENINNSIEDSCSKIQNSYGCSSINENENMGADRRENILVDLTHENINKKELEQDKNDLCLKVQERECTKKDIVSVINVEDVIDKLKYKVNSSEISDNSEVHDYKISQNNYSPYVRGLSLPENNERDFFENLPNHIRQHSNSESKGETQSIFKGYQLKTDTRAENKEEHLKGNNSKTGFAFKAGAVPLIHREIASKAENKEKSSIKVAEEKSEPQEEMKLKDKQESKVDEEKTRKEDETARITAIEETKKIEKEMKEAEFYEAMLKEELRKKKSFSFEETPAKKRRKSETFLKIEPEDKELFALGREYGTRDYIGQRVLQVAHILRNLTFCEESMQVMAKNTTFIRFLLLCVNSKWSSLHQLGLDMLGNVSPELVIEDPSVDRIYQAFFCTINRGISHPNRFFIISCLEILNKICQRDENEDVISRNLDQCIYDQVCRLLSLHDIMILLYTLECLYSMSSMGEKACTYICRSKGAVEMLLALVTVEAQSYGPKACILMRVIETVSGTASSNPQPAQPPPPASPGPGPPLTAGSATSSVQAMPSMVTTSTMTVQPPSLPKVITQNVIRTTSPKTVVGVMPMAAVATPVQVPTKVCTPLVQTMPTIQQQHAHQQAVQENEQFALAWIRANFELSVKGKVEQQDLYKRYLDSCAKMGRKGVIAALHFPRFVRSVFGGTVGPKSHPIPANEVKPGGPVSQSFYEGIKVRDVPLTINIKLVPVTEVPRPMVKKRPQTTTPKSKVRRKKAGSPTSPILKAQLISPNKSNPSSSMPSTSTAEGKVQVSTQTHLGQALLGQNTSPPSTSPPLDNSTLIKSLLASKVSEICMNSSFGMLSDNSQVTQRQQQQQKILQQQLQAKPDSPNKNKLTRINGVIQEPLGSSPENHLIPVGVKGKKEPPQPPPVTASSNTGNTLRPKTPKLDTEDSDSMASTSRDCTVLGGGNISSADDNDNSLTSFEGIFNGLQESLDIDAPTTDENSKQFQNKLNSDEKNLQKKSVNEENCIKSSVIKLVSDESNDVQTEKKGVAEENRVTQTQSKSLMLADLLDKKESPALNGVLGKDLRIGEKGLELVEKAILKETHLNNKDISVNCKKESVVSVNGDSRTGEDCVTVITNESLQCGNKRAHETTSEDVEMKRLKMEEDADLNEGEKNNIPKDSKKSEDETKKLEKEDLNGDEEVRASSTAANLFAALAAEALEDETDLEVPSDPDPQPQTVVVPTGQIRPVFLGDSSPLIVTAAGTRQIIMTPGQLAQQGQVLISTGNQSLPVIVQNQRIVQGNSGQMLVTSQPQQFIMSGNSQSQMLIAQPQTALVQGQPQTVLVAQATPQQPGTKTIIILQPQSQGNASSQQQQQQQKMVVTSQGSQMVVTSVSRTVVQSQSTPPSSPAPPLLVGASNSIQRDNLTTDVVLNSGIQNNPPVSTLHQNGSQIQIISSGVQNNAPILNQSADKTKLVNSNAKPVPGAKNPDGSVFLCEWRGCMRSFKTSNEVYMHVCSTHCPSNPEQETQCLWERCDSMKRKRFSLMTHLYDRHCNAEVLNMMAARRKQLSSQGRTEIPAPATHPPHPGYAPNAAFHAIKRHALEFVNPKELMKTNGGKVIAPPPPPPPPPPPSAVLLAKAASSPVQVKDDNEGPVTKSIRLTASLILRNLVIYSSIGRRFLKGYEPHLASIALSNVESSRTIAQVLADLNDTSSR